MNFDDRLRRPILDDHPSGILRVACEANARIQSRVTLRVLAGYPGRLATCCADRAGVSSQYDLNPPHCRPPGLPAPTASHTLC